MTEKEKELLEVYKELHDVISDLIEDPTTGTYFSAMLGMKRYTALTDLLIKANALGA